MKMMSGVMGALIFQIGELATMDAFLLGVQAYGWLAMKV